MPIGSTIISRTLPECGWQARRIGAGFSPADRLPGKARLHWIVFPGVVALRGEITMTGPWPPDIRYLQLADLTIDLRFRRLIHAGQSADVPQRVFDLLVLFLAEPDKLHTRTELFERLWPGLIVEDTNLSQTVWLLRKALGEERKSWIRTVAKSGYVFQAPEPVRSVSEPPSAAIPAEPAAEQPAESTPAQVDAPTPSLEAARSTRSAWSRHRVRLLALAAIGLAAIASAWFFNQRTSPAEPQLTVALVTIEDDSRAARWPAELLEQWLGWKLASLPGINLLDEAQLAAGAPGSVKVLFLSSATSPSDPAKIKVYVRLRDRGKEQRLEVEGHRSDLPALVDSLSRQIVKRLQPAYAEPWPALELSADAAERYVQAAQAFKHGDWIAAVHLGEEVIARAPRFGLARMQLALAQARLAQATAAKVQMDQAVKLLAGSPPPVIELLQAQRLAIDPTRGPEALAAYAKLADRSPETVSLQLEYAWQLIRAGEPQRALERLADRPVNNDTTCICVGKWLLRANAYAVLSDPVRMRAAAKEAVELARKAGPAWNLEQADALMVLASANAGQFPERGTPPEFEQAAVLYEKGGNATGALEARVLARLSAPLPADGADPALEALLARANAAGYRGLEIHILIASANQHARAGDIAGYRSRLTQAAAIASATGDLIPLTDLNLWLMADDLLSARLSSASARFKQLSEMKLPSAQRMSSSLYAADMSLVRGEYAQALKIIDHAEGIFPPTPAGQPDSEMLTTLICLRSQALLTMGEPAKARANIDRCAKGDRESLRHLALSLRSRAEMLAGDRPQAKALLEQAEQALPSGATDRWVASLEDASLATRLGEFDRSQRLYAQMLQPIQSAGYALLLARALAGQAENAAARGDWARSRDLVADARRLIPNDAWNVIARLDLLEAADALERGDRAKATALGGALHREARRRGDAVLELELHRIFEPGSMSGDCSPAEREALIARTGMRGADANWLNLHSAVPDGGSIKTPVPAGAGSD
ncbi:winged helix-turn-helix domain-containing protein [Lysobacter sp. ESA13C]|uniref:winged helix-turn-helix domain-containing protein n=1 Tax=Lysobacter sp. ESA13C TaxID=2862676 RepID=UPI001CBFA046|nr:winged helix-turn-helix domain-containing protein [Lysobacter sp. ESA13C]